LEPFRLPIAPFICPFLNARTPHAHAGTDRHTHLHTQGVPRSWSYTSSPVPHTRPWLLWGVR
jgi:hypothetical protein